MTHPCTAPRRRTLLPIALTLVGLLLMFAGVVLAVAYAGTVADDVDGFRDSGRGVGVIVSGVAERAR